MARTLKSVWSVVSQGGGGMCDGVEDELARILREEIDRDILDRLREDQLVAAGWHRVPAMGEELPVIPREDREITAWIVANCQGGHHRFYGRVVFELREDAVAFSLVWT